MFNFLKRHAPDVTIIGIALSVLALVIVGNVKFPINFDPLDAARDSSVKVGIDGPGHGSGVVLTDTGLILTNAHVCANGKNGMLIWDRDDNKVDAKVVWMTDKSAGYDFCILQAETPATGISVLGNPTPYEWHPVTFGARPDLGDEIFHIGNMLGIREMISWGRAGQEDDIGDEGIRPGIRYMGTAGPGSSGGGVFNEDGELIGILTWGYHIGAQRGRSVVRIPTGVAAFQPIGQFLEITGQ